MTHWHIFVLIIWLPLPLLSQTDTDQADVSLTISEIFILDIEPNGSPVNFDIEAPTEAGNPITTNSGTGQTSKWINYSSSLAPGASNRQVTAQITSGAVPSGLALKVTASNYNGTGGAGTLGTSAGQKTLATTAKTIINGIGASYTGDGSNNGHQLTYELTIQDATQLDADGSSSVEITFTITD